MTEFGNVRLQPSKRQIAACQNCREPYRARLWDGHARIAASENSGVAVCVLPGTELAFAHEVRRSAIRLWPWHDNVIKHKTAIFRQINKEKIVAHHDALEFPDGQIVLLTSLSEGQQATVLQLPAQPKTAVESEGRQRLAYIG